MSGCRIKVKKVLCYFKYEPESPDVMCDNVYIGSGMWQSETDKVVAWMKRPVEYKPPVESAESKRMREREEFFKDGEQI